MLPEMPIVPYDERYTTVLAHKAILEGGVCLRKETNAKGLADEVSAVIILRDFMESRVFNELKANSFKI